MTPEGGAAARPEQVVRAPRVRFTVLASRLLRMEFDAHERFEDRPSQVFRHRAQPAPEFHVRTSGSETRESSAGQDGLVEIKTAHLHLRCVIDARGFTRDSLSVTLRDTGATWRFGDRDRKNLRGTARTLDMVDGRVPLGEGLVSRSGWAVVDDSQSLVFDADGALAPRTGSPVDLYFFGHGSAYLDCLADFARVAGEMPMIPRFALGNWWSRYWEYSQDELTALVTEFRERGIPLSVCVLDMDWHVTDTGNASSGWTGYTWNRALFPEWERLLAWLHEQGLRTTLNLHPADGVHPHEERYEAMALRTLIDPATRRPVAFDPANPRFVRAYFELLHHPLEEAGVDFWWIDWQQGTRSSVEGLDPLFALNHLHSIDRARDGRRRPFVMSRWAGLGGFRYAMGFSGDAYVTWASLAFQPYFTATAANVAFGWWSHDIGGHQGGEGNDAELFARWVQFGALSPILRLHATKSRFLDWRPWRFDAETFRVVRDAMRLRHALIPYLYSMAWKHHRTARPPIAPMYYDDPNEDDAYSAPRQYRFGTELIAAPFVVPREPSTRLAHQTVWLPTGDWFDFSTGERRRGGAWIDVYGELDSIPLFARAGAIVPLAPMVGWGGVDNPSTLTLFAFAGGDGEFELYEDDGDSLEFSRGGYCITRFTQRWGEREVRITIEPAEGDASLAPARREYVVVLRGVGPNCRATDPEAPTASYDPATDSLTVRGIVLAPRDRFAMTFRASLSDRDRRAETFRRRLATFRSNNDVKRRIDAEVEEILAGRVSLKKYGNDLTAAEMGVLSSVRNQESSSRL